MVIRTAIFTLAVLASALLFALPQAEAETTCFVCRACTPSNPCEVDGSLPDCTSGRGCNEWGGSGAVGCSVGTGSDTPGFCRCTLYDIGCCTTPCQPPYTGCEIS